MDTEAKGQLNKHTKQRWHKVITSLVLSLVAAVMLLVYFFLSTGADGYSRGYWMFNEGTGLEALKIKKIDSKTYAFKTLTDDVIEIGAEKHSPPRPYLKLNQWGGESFLKVGFPLLKQGKFSLSGNKLKWSADILEVVFYPVEPIEIEERGHKFTQNEYGGVEFDTILKEKPEANKITFAIETKGLRFYYQPALTQKEKEAGAFRPENVVGSYAVYHEGNAGKAFHIYRPKVYDAKGNQIWGELNIDEEAGTLTITVDQDWLDKAAYPVTIDPTFGKTTVGATTAESGGSRSVVCKFTAPEAGRITKISVYPPTVTPPIGSWNAVIYSDSAGSPSALLRSQSFPTGSTTGVWHTATLATSYAMSTGQVLWLGYSVNDDDFSYAYDAGAANQFAQNSAYLANPFGTPTFSASAMSVYATYISWGSYKEAGHLNVWGTVANPYALETNTQIVYMYGEGFAASQLYHVGFYDPSTAPNIIATTDPTSTTGGALETQYILTTDPNATAGTWHAVVYKAPLTPPTAYTLNDPNATIEDDFEVWASAIPEFSTVISAIAVASLCFGIYYWMRKRRLAYIKA